MSFFYTTGAGAIDALCIAVVCSLALYFGQPNTRAMALSVIAVFVSARLAMLGGITNTTMIIQATVEFIVMFLWVFSPAQGTIHRAFATLFIVDALIYTATANGDISFYQMALASTVVLYLQLLLIIGEGAQDGMVRLARRNTGIDDGNRGGFNDDSKEAENNPVHNLKGVE